MEFKPTPYRQPVVGDARCALYSLANLLGDRGLLLFNNVNQQTNHLQEASFLRQWHETAIGFDIDAIKNVNSIYPFAIAPTGQRIVIGLDDLEQVNPPEGKYLLALIDFARNNGVHTMGAVWGHDSELVTVDPQYSHPCLSDKAIIFQVFEVVGIRFLAHPEFELAEFTKQELSHIFKLD